MKRSSLRNNLVRIKLGLDTSTNQFYQYVVVSENVKRLAGPFDAETVLKYATNGLGSWLFPNPEIIEPDGLQKVVGKGSNFFLLSRKNFNPDIPEGFCLITKNVHPEDELENIFNTYKSSPEVHCNIMLGVEAAKFFTNWIMQN